MPIINGLNRHQITFSSLEDTIAADNDVRFIDAFVDRLDLQQLGVQSLISSDKKKEGRAAFSDALFLKLYLLHTSMVFAAAESSSGKPCEI